MPDLSLKLPNLTAEISWSWRIRDSMEEEVVVEAIGGCWCGGLEWREKEVVAREGNCGGEGLQV